MVNNYFSKRPRALLRVLGMMLAILLLVGFSLANSVRPAQALSGSGFQPGNIISDSLFYNGYLMTTAEIQGFLNQQVPRCTIGDSGRTAGMPWGNTQIAESCLRDFRMKTDSMPADQHCKGYVGKASETAAEILSKVAQSCGISPKVLLVMLQKEQSLVTDSWPTIRQINVAMGANCPDSGPNWAANCDPKYFGFQKQVHRAAWLLKYYLLHPLEYRYQAGRTLLIQYNPNPACGSRSVTIANSATAALYIYTPYVPNKAALHDLSGSGDDCSATGNLNFWEIYSNWFGSTQGYTVQAPISNFYNNQGGVGGYIGVPMTSMYCLEDGSCKQGFQDGMITTHPTKGDFYLNKTIRLKWKNTGDQWGSMGYPTTSTICITDPIKFCKQGFEKGVITESPGLGSFSITTAFRSIWKAYGDQFGELGFPKTDTQCGSLKYQGCWQQFERGWVYSSPTTGAQVVKNEVKALYAQYRNTAGPLGYPITSPPIGASSYTQTFEGGVVSVSPGSVSVTSLTDSSLPLSSPMSTATMLTTVGLPRIGETVTAASRTWAPLSYDSYTYQWLREGIEISGATSKSYILTASDQNKQISVKVTTTKPGYEQKSATSIPVIPLSPMQTTNAAPSIVGKLRIGETVTAASRTWAPLSYDSYTYQWLREGIEISGATSKSYKLTASDQNKQISVKVTTTKPGYEQKSATSKPALVY